MTPARPLLGCSQTLIVPAEQARAARQEAKRKEAEKSKALGAVKDTSKDLDQSKLQQHLFAKMQVVAKTSSRKQKKKS